MRRELWETVAACSSPLRVDEEKGIIYGVKVLGRYSPNNYGLREAENGTEYPPDAMREAIHLYEGMKVRVNHLPVADRRTPNKERPVEETFGVLRGVRVEEDSIRADLHYNRKHAMAPLVVEDVQRGLGLYGLSHNAGAARERLDRTAKRLVVESIGVVRSVDLVDKPATNRNLWESHDVSTTTTAEPEPKKYTLRSLLESQRTRFTQKRLGWMDRLLEMESMKDVCEDEGEMPAGPAADPADAMRMAFEQSIASIVAGALDGSTDPKEALKKIGEMLKTHGKLTAKEEPEEPPKTESEDAVKKDDEKKDGDKTESVESKIARLERRDACRDLCESLGFTPTKDQLSTLVEISSDAGRKTAAEAFKAAANASNTGGGGGTSTAPAKKPRSAAPGRTLHESQNAADKKIPDGVAGEMGFLRRGG